MNEIDFIQWAKDNGYGNVEVPLNIMHVILNYQNHIESLVKIEVMKPLNIIDYKNLLVKYINHVSECEGTDFICSMRFNETKMFTEEEKSELIKLAI